MKPCACDEGKLMTGFVRREVGGQARPLEPRIGWQRAHDCTYVAERNALIPEAEKLADMHVAHMTYGMAKDQAWSRAFLAAMNESVRTRRMS